MLSKERIKEATENVKVYLEENLIKRIEKFDGNIFSIFKKNSEESLMVADMLFKERLSYLWVIVASYYAMFYMANAVLYKSGYKIGHKIPHKVTSDSLIVFVRDKLRKSILEDFEEAKDEALELASIRADEALETFDYERVKRSRFQYEMTESVKMAKAKTSLDRSKRFIFEMEKLLVR